jgi:hypothetical protein
MVLDMNRELGNPGASPYSNRDTSDWRAKYMAALFEVDRSRLHRLIREAEQIILARECELFANTDAQAERTAINNALHALQALRTCVGLDESDSPVGVQSEGHNVRYRRKENVS